MTLPNSPVYKSKMRGWVYVLNFIFSLQLATTTYFVANYLISMAINEKYISFVFAGMSLVAIISFFMSPYLFNKLGVYLALIGSSFIFIVLLILQAFATNALLAVLLLFFSAIPSALLISALDTLMERFSHDADTGGQRAIFMTMANSAFVAGPVLGGLLSKGGDFFGLWIASAGLIFPFFIISLLSVKKIQRIKYQSFDFKNTFVSITKDKDILNIFLSQGVLYLFFSVMVIYTSVFLWKEFGMDTDKVGYIMAIALTAYVFFTLPLGKLADKKYGEKEMLIIGFAIIALATFWFAVNKSASFFVISFIVFLTRVGASFAQTMSESYFFKHIDGKDADLIAAFRALYPLTSLIAPLLVSPLLFLSSLRSVFLILSFFSLSGIYFALKIKDTK